MEPADTPPMSGSNSLCVATVLLDSGILPMREPLTRLLLEAPGGLIEARAECRDGKAERVEIRNVPSFADRLDAWIEVEGLGSLQVDTAYGATASSSPTPGAWASPCAPTRPPSWSPPA